MDLFKKYLLASVATFAPPGEGGGSPDEGDLDGQEDQGLPEGEEGDTPVEGDVSESDEGALEAEGEEGDDQGQVTPPEKPQSRRDRRIQTLTEVTRETKDRLEKTERELAEYRAAERQRQQASQQESPESRAARRALMDPIEVIREDQRESEQRITSQLHQQAMQFQETNDRSNYEGLMDRKPQLKKYAAAVEKTRLEQQARGVFVPRQVLLELEVGRAALAQADRAAPKARKEGQRRIEGQQSRPAQARGDTATQRGRQGDSVEKRLENVPI